MNINSWFASSKGFSSQKSWHNWQKSLLWGEDVGLVSNNIPPMMRRRMSQLSKLAVHTAIELLNKNNIDYMVFSSRHGELHRSVSLIQDILQKKEASPTAFSQSVHNTAAGLTSIISKQKIPYTSISAGDNSFQSAMLDAWLFLHENPQAKVLLVDFDEPLPEVYNQYESNSYQGFALGLVLSNGKQFVCSYRYRQNGIKHHLPQGLQFLSGYLSPQKVWCVESTNHNWHWQR